MSGGVWNRAARRSGGNRRARILLPALSREDAVLMAQEAAIREEFGEEGVRRFQERLAAREAPAPAPDPEEDP